MHNHNHHAPPGSAWLQHGAPVPSVPAAAAASGGGGGGAGGAVLAARRPPQAQFLHHQPLHHHPMHAVAAPGMHHQPQGQPQGQPPHHLYIQTGGNMGGVPLQYHGFMYNHGPGPGAPLPSGGPHSLTVPHAHVLHPHQHHHHMQHLMQHQATSPAGSHAPHYMVAAHNHHFPSHHLHATAGATQGLPPGSCSSSATATTMTHASLAASQVISPTTTTTSPASSTGGPGPGPRTASATAASAASGGGGAAAAAAGVPPAASSSPLRSARGSRGRPRTATSGRRSRGGGGAGGTNGNGNGAGTGTGTGRSNGRARHASNTKGHARSTQGRRRRGLSGGAAFAAFTSSSGGNSNSNSNSNSISGSGSGTPKRPGRVCDNCRTRKRKCDRGRPCSRCQSEHVECVYSIMDPSQVGAVQAENAKLREMLRVCMQIAGLHTRALDPEGATPAPSPLSVATFALTPTGSAAAAAASAGGAVPPPTPHAGTTPSASLAEAVAADAPADVEAALAAFQTGDPVLLLAVQSLREQVAALGVRELLARASHASVSEAAMASLTYMTLAWGAYINKRPAARCRQLTYEALHFLSHAVQSLQVAGQTEATVPIACVEAALLIAVFAAGVLVNHAQAQGLISVATELSQRMPLADAPAPAPHTSTQAVKSEPTAAAAAAAAAPPSSSSSSSSSPPAPTTSTATAARSDKSTRASPAAQPVADVLANATLAVRAAVAYYDVALTRNPAPAEGLPLPHAPSKWLPATWNTAADCIGGWIGFAVRVLMDSNCSDATPRASAESPADVARFLNQVPALEQLQQVTGVLSGVPVPLVGLAVASHSHELAGDITAAVDCASQGAAMLSDKYPAPAATPTPTPTDAATTTLPVCNIGIAICAVQMGRVLCDDYATAAAADDNSQLPAALECLRIAQAHVDLVPLGALPPLVARLGASLSSATTDSGAAGAASSSSLPPARGGAGGGAGATSSTSTSSSTSSGGVASNSVMVGGVRVPVPHTVTIGGTSMSGPLLLPLGSQVTTSVASTLAAVKVVTPSLGLAVDRRVVATGGGAGTAPAHADNRKRAGSQGAPGAATIATPGGYASTSSRSSVSTTAKTHPSSASSSSASSPSASSPLASRDTAPSAATLHSEGGERHASLGPSRPRIQDDDNDDDDDDHDNDGGRRYGKGQLRKRDEVALPANDGASASKRARLV